MFTARKVNNRGQHEIVQKLPGQLCSCFIIVKNFTKLFTQISQKLALFNH